MATYARGVVTTGDLSAAGLFQTKTPTTQAETIKAEDHNGNTAAAMNIDPSETIEGELVLDTSATTADAMVTRLQAAGGATPVTATIGTSKYLLERLSKPEGNKQFKRFTFSGTRWTKNTIPA